VSIVLLMNRYLKRVGAEKIRMEKEIIRINKEREG